MKTKEELIQFEKDVVDMYKEGKLRSPIHLSGGNEDELIEIFKKIKPQDWVFSTYRSHYHALLKGVPIDELKAWILDNKSIHFMSKKHKIFTSAIVGGTLPIALGVAKGIQLNEQKYWEDKIQFKRRDEEFDAVEMPPRQHVYCFVGDMTGETGGFYEVWKYALHWQLPITFIIEDNGLSTDTDTKEVWNIAPNGKHWYEDSPNIIYYKYKRTYPHYGMGQFIEFKNEKLKQDGTNF